MDKTRWINAGISAFIVFYLLVIITEALSNETFLRPLRQAIKPVVRYPGLWQTFAVFSPEPRKNNMYGDALVRFADGSTEIWQYPRPELMTQWERLQKERYRKLFYDHAYFDNERMLWPDMANFIARKYQEEGKYPSEITLRRHWAEIPQPERGVGQPLPSTYYTEDMATFRFRPKDAS